MRATPPLRGADLVPLLFAWLRNGRGTLGLLGGIILWTLSVVALALAMRANLEASNQSRWHDFGGAESLIRHLHGTAVLWTLAFTALQLISLLVFAFVLRACYRLRAAICFSMGAGFVMAGDLLGLLGMLIWLSITFGVV